MNITVIDRQRVGVDTPTGRTTVRRVAPYRAKVVVRPETPGERLRRLRLSRGWSQADLANQSGVAARTLSHIEVDYAREPTAHTIALLARALGVTMQWLWLGEDADVPVI